MSQLMKVHGIVLSTMNIGEYDKRVVLLTKEKGKMVIFARGARRMNSPFTAACETFVYGEFTVYEGKNYNLNAVAIEDLFSELRDDLHTLYMGFYFCEMADYFTVEGSADVDMLNTLYMGLRTLRRGQMRLPLIQSVYEIKMVALFGLMMETFSCVVCGALEEEEEHVLTHFHSEKGGALCDKCSKGIAGVMPMGASTLYTLQYIISAPLTRLFSFDVKDEVERELIRISKDYQRVHVNHAFKSLEFLELLV